MLTKFAVTNYRGFKNTLLPLMGISRVLEKLIINNIQH